MTRFFFGWRKGNNYNLSCNFHCFHFAFTNVSNFCFNCIWCNSQLKITDTNTAYLLFKKEHFQLYEAKLDILKNFQVNHTVLLWLHQQFHWAFLSTYLKHRGFKQTTYNHWSSCILYYFLSLFSFRIFSV